MKTTQCKSCDATIFWARTRNGRNLPVDAEPVADGNLRVTFGKYGPPTAAIVDARQVDARQIGLFDKRYVSHFATCPNADQHRRRVES